MADMTIKQTEPRANSDWREDYEAFCDARHAFLVAAEVMLSRHVIPVEDRKHEVAATVKALRDIAILRGVNA